MFDLNDKTYLITVFAMGSVYLSMSLLAFMIVTDTFVNSGASIFMVFKDFVFNDLPSYPDWTAVIMYTERMSVGVKLLANTTICSKTVLSSYSSGK